MYGIIEVLGWCMRKSEGNLAYDDPLVTLKLTDQNRRNTM